MLNTILSGICDLLPGNGLPPRQHKSKSAVYSAIRALHGTRRCNSGSDRNSRDERKKAAVIYGLHNVPRKGLFLWKN